MNFALQTGILVFGFLLICLAIVLILKKFRRLDLLFYMIVPLFLFVLGFYLRLQKDAGAVDMGFFFTEISGIFLTMLFVIALLLGQIKYWKK